MSKPEPDTGEDFHQSHNKQIEGIWDADVM